MIATLITGWLICALLARRLFYAAFRRLSSDPAMAHHDACGARWLSVGGPFSLIVAVVLSRETK